MYKIAWCPLCEQGWVVIVKDKQTSQLYAYCTECETEWNDPAKGIKKNLVCLLVHSDNLYHQLLKKYRKVTGINILRSQITNSKPTE